MSNSNLYLQSEWIKAKRILSYTIFSINSAMMNYWSEQVLKDLQRYMDGGTINILFDLSYTNVSMSYYVLSERQLLNVGITKQGRQQFIRLLERNPLCEFKLAVLFSPTMLGALSKHVPRRYEQSNFSGKIFFNRKKAEQWLAAEAPAVDIKTGTLPGDVFDEVMASLGMPDPDVYGNRGTLRMLVMGSLEVVSIAEDKPVIIGRSKDSDLNLRSYGHVAKSVSRQHLKIALKEGRLSITDLNSSNGTMLSGRRLEAGKETFIRRDDIIHIGMMELSVIF